MSAIVHPMAVLCSLSTCKIAPSCSKVSLPLRITRRVSDGPRKAYFKFLGKGFKSNSEGHSIEDRRGELLLRISVKDYRKGFNSNSGGHSVEDRRVELDRIKCSSFNF